MFDKKLSGAMIILLLASACGGEDIEGTWESDDKVAGKRHEFSIDADLVGEGTFYVDNGGGQVFKCKADIEGKTGSREGKYELELQFKGDCGNAQDIELDCQLENDDNLLDCDGLEFNRIEDEELN